MSTKEPDFDAERERWLESKAVAEEHLHPAVFDYVNDASLVRHRVKTHMEIVNEIMLIAIRMTGRSV